MYGEFESWETASATAKRIFDPFSYRITLYERMVPICLAEAPILADRHPLVWRRDQLGDLELVALRGLDPTAEIPGARLQNRTALPLLLQAFPIRFQSLSALAASAEPMAIGVDCAAPMRERDAGSYMIDPQGEVLPGAELKLNALEAFQMDAHLRQQLTEIVFAADLVEPVLLPDAINQKYDLPDLHVVRAFPDDRKILTEMAAKDWPIVMRFLAAQRISLYAMARLIAHAEGGRA